MKDIGPSSSESKAPQARPISQTAQAVGNVVVIGILFSGCLLWSRSCKSDSRINGKEVVTEDEFQRRVEEEADRQLELQLLRENPEEYYRYKRAKDVERESERMLDRMKEELRRREEEP